ncbi:MAG: Enamine/imine deaminase [Chloroflexi bacterium ADurb.Bin180]|nr:MAG: Enamine/imine deaminase [Chloroflexi bacterium ADurb.Bin180]HQJ51493.1 RidA family protein [Anaerolineae bacterium]
MSRQICSTPNAPAAVGPYSQAVRVGDLVFTAGQIGLIPGTRELAGPDIVAQTRQVLLNLQAILEAAGSDLAHAIKTTVFLADMKDWPAMNEVYGEFFPSQPPSRSAIQVVALPLGAKVEIEAVAVVCDAGC